MPRDREINELGKRLGGIPFRREARYRISYGFDATGLRGRCGAVAFPRALDDMVRIVREARLLGVPLFMRGAGTGFSGGSVPDAGGLVVSTEKINRVIGFDGGAQTVEVEAGMVNNDLQEYLRPLGLFYPPDPASFKVSTIGGNIAENAGGPRAYKYGVTRRYIRSLTWVDAGGNRIESSPVGASALLVGAEGTLGAIYSAVLTVVPIPEKYVTALVAAGGDGDALGMAADLMRTGFTPSVMEFIDSKTMRCVSEYRRLSGIDRASSYLFLEIDGPDGDVVRQAGILQEFCAGRGLNMMAARTEQEREILWELRRSISPSLARMGITKVNEDVSLPLGAMGGAVSWIHALAAELRLDCYIFGHCGDGNLHVNIMTDRRRAEEIERTGVFVRRLFEYVTERGGTLSGEHGIGLTKRDFLGLVFGPAEMELQRRIRCEIDADGLFNPGKYFGGACTGGTGDVH